MPCSAQTIVKLLWIKSLNNFFVTWYTNCETKQLANPSLYDAKYRHQIKHKKLCITHTMMIINSRLFYWHVGSYSTARMTLLCQFSPVNSNFSCQPVRWQNICIRNCVVSMQAKSLPLHRSRTSRILPWTFDLWVGTRRAQWRLWVTCSDGNFS